MKKTAIVAAHALVGWALCGATMALALAFTSESSALVLHAIAAPIFFAIISYVYFTKFHFTGPFQTAVIFVGVVVFMDVVVVATLIEQSFDMFRSLTGTWLVFALIFVSTWLTGKRSDRGCQSKEADQTRHHADPRKSTETQTGPGLARINVFAVRHLISLDFTSTRQRRVNENGLTKARLSLMGIGPVPLRVRADCCRVHGSRRQR